MKRYLLALVLAVVTLIGCSSKASPIIYNISGDALFLVQLKDCPVVYDSVDIFNLHYHIDIPFDASLSPDSTWELQCPVSDNVVTNLNSVSGSTFVASFPCAANDILDHSPQKTSAVMEGNHIHIPIIVYNTTDSIVALSILKTTFDKSWLTYSLEKPISVN